MIEEVAVFVKAIKADSVLQATFIEVLKKPGLALMKLGQEVLCNHVHLH